MGIYISGAKGLPEQVQKNKEDIKDLYEDISETNENIDILSGRVETNENDIAGLESKTSAITRDSDNNITQVGEDLNVEGNISLGDGKSIILGTNGHNAIESSGNANSYMDFDSSDNPEIASSGNVYKFTTTGITLNGIPIGGGGSSLYQHNISLTNSTDPQFSVSFSFIDNTSTSYNSFATLRSAIRTKFGNVGNTPVSGIYYLSGTAKFVYILKTTSSQIQFAYIDLLDATTGNSLISNASGITDTVVQIS